MKKEEKFIGEVEKFKSNEKHRTKAITPPPTTTTADASASASASASSSATSAPAGASALRSLIIILHARNIEHAVG